MFKFTPRARGLALRALAAVAAIQLLCGHGCSPPPHAPQPDAHLTVEVSRPTATYYPGDHATYRITVHNPGPVDVEAVGIVSHLDATLSEVSSHCTVTGAAKQAPTSNPCEGMDKIGIGATVVIDVDVLVLGASVAAPQIDVVVSIDGGTTLHGASGLTLANRPGAGFHVYTASGRTSWADIDAATSTIVFSGLDRRTLAYAGPDNGGTWRLPSNGGWRETTDLLVGSADLSDGLQPFIAPRSFLRTTAGLDGRAITLFERETLADGNVVTRAHGALLRGTTMQICVDDDAARAVQACPPASLREYVVGEEQAWFHVNATTGGEHLDFRIARAGDTQILVRADEKGTGRILAIGLAPTAGPAAGTRAGADSRGRWGTLAVDPDSGTLVETLRAADGTLVTLSGSLAPAVNGPAGLAEGTLGDPAAAVWIAQDGPLTVIVGKPNSPVDGLLQFFSR